MKHLTPKLILLAFTGLIMLASCEYEHPLVPAEPIDTTSIDTSGNDTTAVKDTISFSQDIVPIFTENCVLCHKGSNPPDLRVNKAYASLTDGNYVIANDVNNSIIYQQCKPGGGMSSYMSSSELKLLKRWIVAGAKNN